MKEAYQTAKESYQHQAIKKEIIYRRIGLFRLLVVLFMVVFILLTLFTGFTWIRTAISIASVLLCILVWLLHSKAGESLEYLRGMEQIQEEYMMRIDGTWHQFQDTGAEYVNHDHPYTADLDIFGPKSIFQFLNLTHTAFGRQCFAADLSDVTYTAEEILKRQAAVEELERKEQFVQEFDYYGRKIPSKHDLSSLIEHMKEGSAYLSQKALRFLIRLFPVFVAPLFAVSLLIQSNVLFWTASALLVIQTLIWSSLGVKTYHYLQFAAKAKYGVAKYGKLFEKIEQTPFESDRLNEIKAHITEHAFSAASGMKQLDQIMQRIEVRNNGILYLFLNLFFLWDIQCAFSLEQWKNHYGSHFAQWFKALGELESIASFSVFGHVISKSCYPSFTDKTGTMEAKEIGHPLIPNETRVCNDFQLGNKINIISGSNMSGKTTFLRTIGINVILAKTGSRVCCGQFVLSDFDVVTSMRITDDLGEGISTFYAELKRIKFILDRAVQRKNTLFFIDEIFKGTNSKDRIAGANQVIQVLSERDVCGFLTTHDLALCEQSDVAVRNSHFTETYTDGRIYFDYRLREGIAETTNAKYLMEMVGIFEKPQQEAKEES